MKLKNWKKVATGLLFGAIMSPCMALQASAKPVSEAQFIEAISKGNVTQMKAFLASNPKRLKAKLPVDYGSESPVAFAAVCGNLKSFQFLLSRGGVMNRKTVMSHAGMGGNMELMRYVAKKGADLNGKDFLDRTALWHVVYRREFPKAQFLLELGVDPNVGGGAGVPLLLVVGVFSSLKDVKMVQLLLSKGAKADPKWDIYVPEIKKLVEAAAKKTPPVSPRPATQLAVPPSSRKPQPWAVKQGEISLFGTVASVDADNKKLVLKATSFMLPNGNSATLAVPKEKTVQVGDATTIAPPSKTDKMALGDLKAGDAVTVTGPDAGSGKELVAREIVVGAK